MRMCVWILVVVAARPASADDSIDVRVRHLGDTPAEPWLHLDPTIVDRARAEGGLLDGRAVLLDLGPRARLAAEGTWWQTGLAPSMFADDLHFHGWRASGELSYDLGPFRVGLNASMSRTRDDSHRMVGLFAYRAFRLSRWMRAWIVLGIAFEQWRFASAETRDGLHVGLTLGTTFR
jgi:hypothetical protein